MADSQSKSLRLPTPSSVQFIRRAMERAEQWPVAGGAVRRMQAVEEWAVAELKYRLDELPESGDGKQCESGSDAAQRARELMVALLAEADNQTLDQACERQYVQAMEQLCPDQAKMLAALGDGRVLPLIHVGAGLPAGPVREIVLENATSLGREAGVTLRESVPLLVGQMRTLGLLHIGPEDDTLKTAYEVLAADTVVREANTYIKNTLRMWPRLQRHTVSLSAFGQDLWRVAGPGE